MNVLTVKSLTKLSLLSLFNIVMVKLDSEKNPKKVWGVKIRLFWFLGDFIKALNYSLITF